jgi:alkanesulfonate monooxygenase SsuD/methylene tetrahydromethanopterin reductase-like flavin-dependent oxidoreductase (luciferase family)
MTEAAPELGISLTLTSGRSPGELGTLAGDAERAGFSTVLVTERVGDVFAAVPALLAATTRATVGTAIANLYLHPPALTAMTLASLDEQSGGRFVLGLGVANPALNQGLLGLPDVPPLEMTEEYVGLVRAILSGQPYDGRVYRQPSPLALDRPPVRPDPPIHLAALQPRMLALAGRIADGVIITLMSPEQLSRAVSIVRGAAAEAGRDPAAVRVTCVLPCCLSDDAELAQRAARGVATRFARHASAGRLFAEHDPQNRMDEVRTALAVGDPAGAAAAVPQDVADGFVARGSARSCRERIAEYVAAGPDLVVVQPMPVQGTWDGVIERLIHDLAPSLALPG